MCDSWQFTHRGCDFFLFTRDQFVYYWNVFIFVVFCFVLKVIWFMCQIANCARFFVSRRKTRKSFTDPRRARTTTFCRAVRAQRDSVKLKATAWRRAAAFVQSSACFRLGLLHSPSRRSCRCRACRTWQCSQAWTSTMSTGDCWRATRAWKSWSNRGWVCGGIYRHFAYLSTQRHFRWWRRCRVRQLRDLGEKNYS